VQQEENHEKGPRRLRASNPMGNIRLQILSLTLFEKMPVSQALAQLPPLLDSASSKNHQCSPCF
jgi:hypothetical protein